MSCYASSHRKASLMPPKTNKGQENVQHINAARAQINRLKFLEFLDALEAIGVIGQAARAVDIGKDHVYRLIYSDPDAAAKIEAAQAVGRARRRDYLETLAYKIADEGNPTMVMFLLKREDPSYRESYNVNNTSQPTNYVIDLGLPDNPTPLTDVTPAEILDK